MQRKENKIHTNNHKERGRELFLSFGETDIAPIPPIVALKFINKTENRIKKYKQKQIEKRKQNKTKLLPVFPQIP